MNNSAAGSAFRYALTGDKSLAADARRRLEAMMKEGYWWEHCTLHSKSSWHYNEKGEEIRSAGLLLWRVAKARSFGGNVLANIAPRPDGSIPDQYYDLCEDLAEWMKHSRESWEPINGGGIWPKNSNVPVTISGNNWYLHSPPNHWNKSWAFPERIDTIELKNIPQPKSVTLLRTGETLEYEYDAVTKTMKLVIPADKRTKMVDVVKVVMPKNTGGYHELWTKADASRQKMK